MSESCESYQAETCPSQLSYMKGWSHLRGYSLHLYQVFTSDPERHFSHKYSTSLYFPEFSSVCTIVLSHEQKLVCCFVPQEVCFEMKKLTHCERVLGVWRLLRCCLSTEVLFDTQQHHLRITVGKICSFQWARTDKNTATCSFWKQGKPKIMEGDVICWLLFSFHRLKHFLSSRLGWSTMQEITWCYLTLLFFYYSL